MKTLIQITLGSLFMILGLMGCGSNNNSTAASSIYSYQNGLCYNTQTNTQVATTYCTTGSAYNSSMFSYNGSSCTNLLTGTQVSTAYCTSNPYSYTSSGCYDSIGGTYVSTQYCSTTTSGTSGVYQYINGICYSTATGTAVTTSLCSTTTSTVGGYSAGSCVGTYYVLQGGNIAQIVQCNGSNCRGYVLYSVATKTQVVCQ